MNDLIPRKSWTLAFEEMEDVVFHLKELNDLEYLELVDIIDPIFSDEKNTKEKELAKLKAVDFMLIEVEGIEKKNLNFKVKLNLSIHILRYVNPDVLELKKQ